MGFLKNLLIARFKRKEKETIEAYRQDIAKDMERSEKISEEFDELINEKIARSEKEFDGGISLNELLDDDVREKKRIKGGRAEKPEPQVYDEKDWIRTDIRDDNGDVVAYTLKGALGELAYDAENRYLGCYESVTDSTRDTDGQVVSKGNHLGFFVLGRYNEG